MSDFLVKLNCNNILVILVLFVFGLNSSFVHSSEFDNELALKKAIALHENGVNGVNGAAESATEILLDIIKSNPKNSLATVYLGSAYTLIARDADNVVNKVRYSNRGIRYLDLALEISPENFYVRLIRAKVNSSLPKMFHRHEKATEDMLKLDDLYWSNGSNGSKSMAVSMISIYEQLIDRAPDKGPWKTRLNKTKKDSRG